MRFQVRVEKEAAKNLERIPKFYQERILTILALLSENPYIGKKLEGRLKGAYSYRLGPYRIIYKIYKKFFLIIIIRIGHRQGVY